MQTKTRDDNPIGGANARTTAAVRWWRAAWTRRLCNLAALVAWSTCCAAEAKVTGELVAQCCAVIEGNCIEVAALGDRLYVLTQSCTLWILDASDPANIRRLGNLTLGNTAGGTGWVTVSTSVSFLRVVGNLAYVVKHDYTVLPPGGPWGDEGLSYTDSYLLVLDVTDPASIREVGRFGFGDRGGATELEVAGDQAYLAYGTVLQVLDVSDATRIRELWTFDTGLVSQDLEVTASRAYVVHAQGLTVLDMSDARHLGSFEISRPARVRVVGDLAYVVANGQGLQVLEASDAAGIRRLGRFDTGLRNTDVEVAGNRAYVADEELGLQVLDVSDPGQIRRLGALDVNWPLSRLEIEGNVAYAWMGYGARLEVLDVRDPSNLKRLTDLRGDWSGSDVQIAGNWAYLAAGPVGLPVRLEVFEVKEDGGSTSLRRRGHFERQGAASMEVASVQVAGNVAYVLATGLDVLDVTDPADIRRLGGLGDVTHPQRFLGCLQVEGSFAYWPDNDASGRYGSLQVWNVSDPANLRHASSIHIQGWVRVHDVQVVENLAYVALHESGAPASKGRLEVLEVSDPAHFRRLGGSDTTGFSYGVQVVGGRAYVVGELGLLVADVSDPAQVRRLGSFDTGGWINSVQVVGNLAFLVGTGFDDRVHVVDVGDPATIRSAGHFDAPGRDGRIQVVGNLAFVPVRKVGLQVFRLSGGPGFMPGLLLEPEDQSVPLGGLVTFRAMAVGDEVLRYQWRKDGRDLPEGGRTTGATSPVLTIPATQPDDDGRYSVVVRNAAGSVESRAAVLTLQADVTRPVLTIRLAEGRVSLTLLAPAGRRWEVQYTGDLTAPIAWQELATVTVEVPPVVVEDPEPLAGLQRFYRAVEKP